MDAKPSLIAVTNFQRSVKCRSQTQFKAEIIQFESNLAIIRPLNVLVEKPCLQYKQEENNH